MTDDAFTHVTLPHLGNRVLRLGLAGNYGVKAADVRYAAERGVNFWVWSPRFKQVTPVLRELLARERERHVVAAFGLAFTGAGPRKDVEKTLKLLGVEQLDIYLLSWLGRMSFFTDAVQEGIARLKQEGKIRAVGTSIHDRQRAGALARDSILDALMIRYNAKHPGAEQDIFEHLAARDPVMIGYTATSWGQLLKPIPRLELPPWPGAVEPAGEGGAGAGGTPPPLSAALCYRFCLSSPHLHVVLTGPKNRAQLDENLAALDAGPLPADQEEWVRAYGRAVKAHKRIPFL